MPLEHNQTGTDQTLGNDVLPEPIESTMPPQPFYSKSVEKRVSISVVEPEQLFSNAESKQNPSSSTIASPKSVNASGSVIVTDAEHIEEHCSVDKLVSLLEPDDKAIVGDDAPSAASGTNTDCSELLLEKLVQLTELMNRQKILLADLAINDLERRITNINLTQLPPDVQEAIQKFRFNDAIKAVKRDAQNVRKMMREAQTKDPNWILSNEDKGRRMKSFHRLNNENGIISFKVEARSIRCNIFNLLALFNEFDLLPAILSTSLASIDIEPLLMFKFRKLMHIICTPIWPFAARDVALDMSGFDVLDQKCVVVCGESFEKADDVGISAPESSSKLKRISTELSGVVLRPLGEDLTSMVVIATLDLKLGVVPPALLQFVTKQLTLPIFQMFVRQAEKLPDSKIHQERLAADRFGLYEMIRQTLYDYDYEKSRLAERDASSHAEDADHSAISLSHQSSHLATI